MIEELDHHGYQPGPGTLYPVLHSLERTGYLTREDRVVGGKVRRYYAITDEGRQALAETRETIGELIAEVLEGRGPCAAERGRARLRAARVRPRGTGCLDAPRVELVRRPDRAPGLLPRGVH